MSNTYRLRLSNKDNALISTDGDLDAIAYHIRKADIDPTVEYVVTFVETDGIDGDSTRTVSDLTADGEVVSLVLKKKLKQERTANAGQGGESADTTTVQV